MQSTEGKGKRITAEQFYDSQDKFDFSIEGQKSHRNIMEFAEAYSQSGAGPTDALKSALERVLWNFKLLLAQKPVREAAEAIAEAERALSGAGSPEETKPDAIHHLLTFIGCIADLEDEEFTQVILDELRNLAAQVNRGAASSSQSAEPTEKYRFTAEPGLCSTHTGGPHKIERTCRDWKPGVAQSAPEPPSQPWSPNVEVFRREMMKRFSDKLSMEEIADFSYAMAGGGSTGERAEPPTKQEIRARIYAQDICRELYDRFAMGGWEPIDAHNWLISELLEFAHSAALAEGSRTTDGNVAHKGEEGRLR